MDPIWSQAWGLSRRGSGDSVVHSFCHVDVKPLMSLVDILSDWIEAYDHEHRPMPIVSGVDVETFI